MVQVIVPTSTPKRHAYAMRIKPTDVMPAMATVDGAATLPGYYCDVRSGKVDLHPGEFLLVGQQERYGYSKVLYGLDDNGSLYQFSPDSDLREAVKAWVERGVDRRKDRARTKRGIPARGSLRRADLRGKGDNGLLARVVLMVHRGMTLDEIFVSWCAVPRLTRIRAAVEERKRERKAAAARAAWEAKRAEAAVEADWAATMAMHGDAIASAVL